MDWRITLGGTQRWVLSLLYAPGETGTTCEPVDGSLRIMKELFIISREAGVEDFYSFVPYRYGPCSFQVYRDLDDLRNLGLVMQMPISGSQYKRYSLTTMGADIAKEEYSKLDSRVKSHIARIKKKFNGEPIYAIMAYVYQKFPDMTTRTEWAFR
jgi:uncharacterized protein YwgA